MTADDFLIENEYPADADGGADYFTKAARGDIIEQRHDGDIVRPERVVITPIDVPFEGRICIGEKTVRHLAHKFGMFDHWSVTRLQHEHARLQEEHLALVTEYERQQAVIENLRALEPPEGRNIFVDISGAEHATRYAALSGNSTITLTQEATPDGT